MRSCTTMRRSRARLADSNGTSLRAMRCHIASRLNANSRPIGHAVPRCVLLGAAAGPRQVYLAGQHDLSVTHAAEAGLRGRAIAIARKLAVTTLKSSLVVTIRY